MEPGTMDELLTRLKWTLMEDVEARPIAFITGSGISRGAVAMSGEIIQLIRKDLSPTDAMDLDSELAQYQDDGEKYQKAFQWFTKRRSPKFRDRVIAIATARAYNDVFNDVTERSTDEIVAVARDDENNVDRWNLPVGQESLGRLIVGLEPNKVGPVLTTNFDPLTEISIRKSGGQATTRISANDTAFLGDIRFSADHQVVHLHGYWRDSTTLSTPEQLELERPAIEAGIRRIFEDYTVIIIGYSGWDDAVTRVIRRIIKERNTSSLDVLWCLHEPARDVQANFRTNKLQQELVESLGNVQFYAGIDANRFLPELEQSISEILTYEGAARSARGAPTMLGWTRVDADFIESVRGGGSARSALKFYDGRVPRWQDAASSFVPVRELSLELFNRFKRDISEVGSAMSLLIGTSGEGKTTIGMQVCRLLAIDESVDADIFYLNSDYLGSINEIMDLGAKRKIVLVVDDSYRFVTQLEEIARCISTLHNQNMHILAISRDSDWESVNASRIAWDSLLDTKKHVLSGISRLDAVSIVGAWEKIGEDALGELSNIDSTEGRVSSLCDSSVGLGHKKGSLLGALLTVRYGEGLRDHIESLMDRLRTRLVRGSCGSYTLMDAFVMISIPYSYGVVDLDHRVLARAMNMNVADVIVDVLGPLGEEAVIDFSGDRIVLRHELIAVSVLDICVKRKFEYANLLSVVVAAAACEWEESGYSPRLRSIAYISSEIADRPTLAIEAACAARAAVPKRLSYVTSLSAAYRNGGDVASALTINEGAADLVGLPSNFDQLRGFFTEWGVAEGMALRFARNVVLVAVSLQDSHTMGQLYADKIDRSLSCLMLALRRLHGDSCTSDSCRIELIAGLSAAIELFEIIRFRSSPQAWLRDARQLVSAHGIEASKVFDRSAIQQRLTRAVVVARGLVEEPLPASVPSAQSSFEGLISSVSDFV